MARLHASICGDGNRLRHYAFLAVYSPATRSLKPVVRAVAYFVDFQQVSLYPGVDVNRRLRLYENGVVSYAEERGWDIVISVEKVQ